MTPISRKDAKGLGLTHYYTGKPCPADHDCQRFVSTFGCVDCTKEHHKRYRKDAGFREREQSYKIQYRDENREAINSYAARRWREEPKARETNRKSKERNREKINARQRIASLSAEHALRQKEHRRRMYIKFRQDRLLRAKQATARRRGAEGRYTANDIALILAKQRHLCPVCQADLSTGYHVDHIHPISRGGTNWPDNIQCLCPSCNMSKGAKTMQEFLEIRQVPA